VAHTVFACSLQRGWVKQEVRTNSELANRNRTKRVHIAFGNMADLYPVIEKIDLRATLKHRCIRKIQESINHIERQKMTERTWNGRAAHNKNEELHNAVIKHMDLQAASAEIR
jgi:hypothetical protein